MFKERLTDFIASPIIITVALFFSVFVILFFLVGLVYGTPDQAVGSAIYFVTIFSKSNLDYGGLPVEELGTVSSSGSSFLLFILVVMLMLVNSFVLKKLAK